MPVYMRFNIYRNILVGDDGKKIDHVHGLTELKVVCKTLLFLSHLRRDILTTESLAPFLHDQFVPVRTVAPAS